MTKPDLRDPADLRPHSILHHIPAPAKDAPEVIACAETIHDQDGHVLPVIIDGAGHLLTDDSRLRWMAVRRLGLMTIPVTVQPTELAPVIALNAIVHRAHFTKSALAYLAVPLLKPAFEAARSARLECLKKGQNPVAHGVRYGQTMDELAATIGICPRLLDSAKQVHAEFEKDKKKYSFTIEGGSEDGAIVHQTLREHFEPKILRHQQGDEHEGTRPIGLGGVMKAIGSIRSTKGAAKVNASQLELFTGGLDALGKRLSYWNELDADQKRKAEPKLDAFFDAMDNDLLELSYEKIKKRLKDREIN